MIDADKCMALAGLLEAAASMLREAANQSNALQFESLSPTTIKSFGFSVRARRAIYNACLEKFGTEVHQVHHLISLTETDLLTQKNCGPTTVEEIKRKLAKRHLALLDE